MKALITGVTGQDGFYLSKLLLEKGYEVHGLIRRSSTFNTDRIDTLISKNASTNNFLLYYSDLLDPSSLTSLINNIEPDEIYNLAAQSHVAVSFKNPNYSINTSTTGTTTILEAVKNYGPAIYFANKIFRKDKEIILALVSDWKQDHALKYIHHSLINDPDVIKAHRKKKSSKIKYEKKR